MWRWKSNVAAVLAAWSVALALFGGCQSQSPPRHPVMVIGVDGLEWDIMLPMIRQGKLPVMAGLMERGIFGELVSFLPTFSPIIWTSMVTGKLPEKHGIHGFAYKDRAGQPRLFKNVHRKTKAVWNILTDYGLDVHSVGWWITFPAEEIQGIMVSQTNTLGSIWKGAVLKGVPGQVYPEDLQSRVMEIVDDVHTTLPQRLESVFGRLSPPLSDLSRRLWDNTLWVFGADATYAGIAKWILASQPDYDLFAVYFGGADTVAHRFWRYMKPEEFTHRPTKHEIENFNRIIPDYYSFIDATIGELLAMQPEDTTVFIVSDHGIHAINETQIFKADNAPDDLNSGHHLDAPNGVFIAAGRHIRAASSNVPPVDELDRKDLSIVGSFVDIGPTLLALKGIPIGADMDGQVLTNVLEESFLDRYPVATVETHDTREWLAQHHRRDSRDPNEKDRMQQLRALGYVQ